MKHGVILVTGSRTEFNRCRIELGMLRAQRMLHNILPSTREACSFSLVHGAAKGADWTADQVAQVWGYSIIPFPADWETHGKSAGPIRNQKMVDYVTGVLGPLGIAAVCLAFPSAKSIGTWDCIKRAAAAGIMVIIHP